MIEEEEEEEEEEEKEELYLPLRHSSSMPRTVWGSDRVDIISVCSPARDIVTSPVKLLLRPFQMILISFFLCKCYCYVH
jgi:hypothetical protein